MKNGKRKTGCYSVITERKTPWHFARGNTTKEKINEEKIMRTILRKTITITAAICTIMVVYFFAFMLVAWLFNAEHWSFILALFPALAAGAAVIWEGEK